MRSGDPFPDRPEHRDGQALAVARGDVDQEIVDVLPRDGFEVVGNGIEMPAGDERRPGLEDVPGVGNKAA